MQDHDLEDSHRPQRDQPLPPDPTPSADSDSADEVDPWDMSERVRRETPPPTQTPDAAATLPPPAPELESCPPTTMPTDALTPTADEPKPVSSSDEKPDVQPPRASPEAADVAATKAPDHDAPRPVPPLEPIPPESAARAPSSTPAGRMNDPAYPASRPLPRHLKPVDHTPPAAGRPPATPGLQPIDPRPPAYAPPMRPPQPWVILIPRIWPALTTMGIAFAVAIVLSIVAIVAAFFLDGGLSLANGRDFGQAWAMWMSTLLDTPWGPALLILPTQLSILSAAVIAAACSPVRFRQRLGLVASRHPWWTYPLFMVGTPIVAMGAAIIGFIAQQTMHRNGVMIEGNDMTQLVQGPPGVTGLITILLLLALLPAIGEEMLFRGLLQRRLLRRWPVIGAIALATGMFLLAHLNPLQMIMLIPLGIWLGVVAWQSGSILPAIACHLANNVVAITMARLFASITTESSSDMVAMVGLAMIPMFIMAIAMIASVIVVIYYAKQLGPPTITTLPEAAMRRLRTYNPPPNAIVHQAPTPPPPVPQTPSWTT